MNNNMEQITYDQTDEVGYIYLTEPNKLDFYTEMLPENPEIILNIGKEVPIVGVELAGESAKKILALNDENKKFTTKTDESGHEYFSFRLENKPVYRRVSYERIVDIHFLFADADCLDFIGIDIYSLDPHYDDYLNNGARRENKKGSKMKEIIKKVKSGFKK